MKRLVEERFWKKVSQQPNEGCWLWMASKDRDGYGYFAIEHGSLQKAHRVSWEWANGAIPEGFCVCHHCDTPACVRPSHLFLGTHKDNAIDRNAKNRHASGDRHWSRLYPERMARGDAHYSRLHPEKLNSPKGEANGSARLTADAVREIRLRDAAGEDQEAIAATFGVSSSNVSLIVSRRRWKHVA